MAAGDVVTVTRIDRLARSIFDLFAIVKQITDKNKWIDLIRHAEISKCTRWNISLNNRSIVRLEVRKDIAMYIINLIELF
jgi:hypothetical protein